MNELLDVDFDVGPVDIELVKEKQKLRELLEFGRDIDWKILPSPESYYPTRLEYMVGKALQGLLAGKPPKEYDNCVKAAVKLASQMEERLDALDSEKG